MRFTKTSWIKSTKINVHTILPIMLLSGLGFSGHAAAAQFNVSNEAELKAAIEVATSNQEDDVVDFGNNAIELSSKLWISNLDAFEIRIQNGTLRRAAGAAEFGLVEITGGTNGSKVAFEEMILEGGSESGDGGAINANTVDIEIRGSIVRNNRSVGGDGGAVYLRSKSIEIANSTFSNNSATVQGGALAFNGAQSGFITDTVFDSNSSNRGGAIDVNAMTNALTIAKTTFTLNESTSRGGAISTRGEMNISLSTFYQNKALFGGAIYVQPTNANDRTTITRTTFSNNIGTGVADTLYFQSRLVAPVLSSNIIIGSNQTGSVNCTDLSLPASRIPLVVSNNVSDDNSCGPTNLVLNGASLFTSGVPADNGGSTPTIALNPTSAAIDVGAPLNAGSCTVASDQRGEPVLGNCDAGSYEFQPIASDSDNDGTPDASDNCPTTPNEDQNDFDFDGLGDACDDSDGDLLFDNADNCPTDSNADQLNTDNANDGGDVCDNDDDNDGVNDGQDAFPLDASESLDTDGDGTGNNADFDDDNDGQLDINEVACGSDPLNEASVSADADGDNIPDCAEQNPDSDGDTIPDAEDNCPATANQDQLNTDNTNDGGNACDSDDDNDGVVDSQDAFPLDASESLDTDGDGTGNNVDLDDDNDGQSDADELSCESDPLNANSLSADIDGDNIPDCIDNNNDLDNDNDGVLNDVDNCPAIANADQLNTDNANDGGDACDNDDDNDGISDISDAFPLNASESLDTDGDGIGNNTDSDDDNDGQLDTDESLCGSNPFDATSTSSDVDNDGIPDCADDVNGLDGDGDGINDNVDNCPTDANANQADANGNGIGDACDTTIGSGNIKPSIAAAAAELNLLLTSVDNRLFKYYLEYAKSQLNTALTDSYWTDNNTVTDSGGRTVFYRVGLAVYKMELVADSFLTDPALKASLDSITTTLLSDMRLLATNEIDAAVADSGNGLRIRIAQNYLEYGDKYRDSDYLYIAISNYGYAWFYANLAM